MTTIAIALNILKCDSTDDKLGIKCPFLNTARTPQSGYAIDYFCGGTPENRKITGYVEWNRDVPEVPDWCPFRVTSK